MAAAAARELELVAAHRRHHMDGIARAVPERHRDLAAARREADRAARRRLDAAELAVHQAFDAGDIRALTAAAEVSGIGGEQLLVEQVVDGVAVVDDRAERRQALTGRAGGGRGQRNVSGRADETAHERAAVVAPQLVDAAEQIGEGHRVDDGVVGESAHHRVEEGAVGAPRPGREGHHAPRLAARLVEVEDGQVGQEAVGLEHLVAFVAEVGRQSVVDGHGLLAATLAGVEQIRPGQGEPRLERGEAGVWEGDLGDAEIAQATHGGVVEGLFAHPAGGVDRHLQQLAQPLRATLHLLVGLALETAGDELGEIGRHVGTGDDLAPRCAAPEARQRRSGGAVGTGAQRLHGLGRRSDHQGHGGRLQRLGQRLQVVGVRELVRAVGADAGGRVDGDDPRQVELGTGAVGGEVGDVGGEPVQHIAATLLSQLDAQGVDPVLGQQQAARLTGERGVLKRQAGGEVAVGVDAEVVEGRGGDVEQGAHRAVLKGESERRTRRETGVGVEHELHGARVFDPVDVQTETEGATRLHPGALRREAQRRPGLGRGADGETRECAHDEGDSSGEKRGRGRPAGPAPTRPRWASRAHGGARPGPRAARGSRPACRARGRARSPVGC